MEHLTCTTLRKRAGREDLLGTGEMLSSSSSAPELLTWAGVIKNSRIRHLEVPDCWEWRIFHANNWECTKSEGIALWNNLYWDGFCIQSMAGGPV